MNITPKANPQDVAGVLRLLAFLADKDACAARLTELQAAAIDADAKAVAANTAAKAAASDIEDANAIKAEADDAIGKARLEQTIASAAKTDIDSRTAALALAEKAHLDNVATLAKNQADYDKAIEVLVEKRKQIDLETAQLKIDQDAIAADKELLAAFKNMKAKE